MNKTLLTSTLLALTFGISNTQAAAVTWKDLCSADGSVEQNSSDFPKVNYQNSLIKRAATKLSEVAVAEQDGRKSDLREDIKSIAFNPYTDFERTYGLCARKSKYKAGGCKPEQLPPKEYHVEAHNMLTIMCGEYRDRLSTLKKKLQWLSKINLSQDSVQTYNRKKKVFDQMTGQGYQRLTEISKSLHKFRENKLGALGSRHLEVDQKSVQPMTICEYRYIMSEYLSKEKEVNGQLEYDAYEAGLTSFVADKKNCSRTDHAYYYEFRGDGNIKAQSLESNGQLWFSRAFSTSCTVDKKTGVRKLGRSAWRSSMKDSDCNQYFKNPYATRDKINQQAMLRMFYYPNKLGEGENQIDLHQIMSIYSSSDVRGFVMVTEDITGDGVGELVALDPKEVGSCGWNTTIDSTDASGACLLVAARNILKDFDEDDWTVRQKADDLMFTIIQLASEEKLKGTSNEKLLGKGIKNAKKLLAKKFANNPNILKGVIFVTETHEDYKKEYATAKDRGLTRVFPDKNEMWDRLTIVLDRHTDWYSIDTYHYRAGYYKPTFSPWVASSYYIYNSHSFVMPGYAMGNKLDPGRMHWMYVQKVKKKNWYNAEKMDAKWPIPVKEFDLLNFWFDEVTFSRSNLGSHENGWDRYGNVANSEIESIFWLYQAEEFEL
ncbi:MAG: hypothetical protein HN509_08125 [Halobacteriovoraceae bacterium]|jgi:hypothetical protein|nr:hypothetical protein [Halobacteriovoraceae bacterium]MBT5095488.1 hypothetical protein [Halobacteriovoraceae bacterium]